MSERRLSTPMVLAASSAMLAVGAVAFFSVTGGSDAPAEEAAGPNALRIDTSSPELAAQSFYDAWRRRRWVEAEAISVGSAREAVLQKRASDEALEHAERALAERSWDALANSPLTLDIGEVEMLGGERYRLQCEAEYLFVNEPYRRRVSFLVRQEGEEYRVAEMELGEVLTEIPSIFRGAGDEL